MGERRRKGSKTNEEWNKLQKIRKLKPTLKARKGWKERERQGRMRATCKKRTGRDKR